MIVETICAVGIVSYLLWEFRRASNLIRSLDQIETELQSRTSERIESIRALRREFMGRDE